MDSATPPPTPAPPASAPYAYAATDERARGAVEKELCEKASSFDWLYWGSTVLLSAGAISLDQFVLQSASQTGVRLMGPGLVGLTWGTVIGGGYLALPKCDPGLVRYAGAAEGNVHLTWPGALAFALLAGATGPLVVGIETGTGPSTDPWPTYERSLRLVVAGVTAFGGALLPYAIPPKTWRAAKELQRIRAGADTKGAYLTYSVRF